MKLFIVRWEKEQGLLLCKRTSNGPLALGDVRACAWRRLVALLCMEFRKSTDTLFTGWVGLVYLWLVSGVAPLLVDDRSVNGVHAYHVSAAGDSR